MAPEVCLDTGRTRALGLNDVLASAGVMNVMWNMIAREQKRRWRKDEEAIAIVLDGLNKRLMKKWEVYDQKKRRNGRWGVHHLIGIHRI